MRPQIVSRDAAVSTQVSARDRWPRAWRLLFILGCSLLLWGLIAASIRWL